MKLKKITAYLRGNWFFLGILGFFLVTRGPGILENFKNEGNQVSEFSFSKLNGDREKFSALPAKKIFIFWATWCAPCKLELMRYNKAIKEGELPKDHIFIVNMREDESKVKEFLQKQNFDFHVIMDPHGSIARKFYVSVTPTVINITGDTIETISTGVSPLGVYRSANFLN